MMHTRRKLGCAPGGSCCTSCSSTPKLRATQCDQDGNCYTDGVLTAAPLTNGGTTDPGNSINYGLIAAAAVAFFFLYSGGGRR